MPGRARALGLSARERGEGRARRRGGGELVGSAAGFVALMCVVVVGARAAAPVKRRVKSFIFACGGATVELLAMIFSLFKRGDGVRASRCFCRDVKGDRLRAASDASVSRASR